MRKITKFGIVIIVVIGALAGPGLGIYHAHRLYEESYMSGYYYRVEIYRVEIDTDSVLHNVTLYLPLPVLGESLGIGDEIIAGNASKPDDWDCSIIETEHGKMLKITAEKIAPELILNEINVQLPVDHEINTKDPIGNEPLLLPMYNVTKITCDFPFPNEQDAQVNCYSYESRVYVDYESSPDAEVSIYIDIDLTGRNDWWVYGWSGNNYRNKVNLTSSGRHGWCVALGKLVEGEGRYDWM
jgi:hypothetical protein